MQIVIQLQSHQLQHMTHQQMGAFVAHCYTLKDLSWVKVTKDGDHISAEIAFKLPSAAQLVDSAKLQAQLEETIKAFADMEPFPCPCGCGAFISVSPCLRQSGELVENGLVQAEINALLVNGSVVECIKLYRERTQKGLRDSKEVVDTWLCTIPDAEYARWKIAYGKHGFANLYPASLATSDPYNRKGK